MARTTESSDVARKGIQARDVWFVMALPGRMLVTGTGDGRHGRESRFAAMLDL